MPTLLPEHQGLAASPGNLCCKCAEGRRRGQGEVHRTNGPELARCPFLWELQLWESRHAEGVEFGGGLEREEIRQRPLCRAAAMASVQGRNVESALLCQVMSCPSAKHFTCLPCIRSSRLPSAFLRSQGQRAAGSGSGMEACPVVPTRGQFFAPGKSSVREGSAMPGRAKRHPHWLVQFLPGNTQQKRPEMRVFSCPTLQCPAGQGLCQGAPTPLQTPSA